MTYYTETLKVKNNPWAEYGDYQAKAAKLMRSDSRIDAIMVKPSSMQTFTYRREQLLAKG